MKPFPIATCFLEMVKKLLCIAVLFGFLFRVPVLDLFGLIKTFWIFQHLAPAIP